MTSMSAPNPPSSPMVCRSPSKSREFVRASVGDGVFLDMVVDAMVDMPTDAEAKRVRLCWYTRTQAE